MSLKAAVALVLGLVANSPSREQLGEESGIVHTNLITVFWAINGFGSRRDRYQRGGTFPATDGEFARIMRIGFRMVLADACSVEHNCLQESDAVFLEWMVCVPMSAGCIVPCIPPHVTASEWSNGQPVRIKAGLGADYPEANQRADLWVSSNKYYSSSQSNPLPCGSGQCPPRYQDSLFKWVSSSTANNITSWQLSNVEEVDPLKVYRFWSEGAMQGQIEYPLTPASRFQEYGDWNVCMNYVPRTPCCSYFEQCPAPAYANVRWLNERDETYKPLTWCVDPSFDAFPGESSAIWLSEMRRAVKYWEDSVRVRLFRETTCDDDVVDIRLSALPNEEWEGLPRSCKPASGEPVYACAPGVADFTPQKYPCGEERAPYIAAFSPQRPMYIYIHMGLPNGFTWNSQDHFRAMGGCTQSRRNILTHELGHTLLLDHTGDCGVLVPPVDSQDVMCTPYSAGVSETVHVSLLFNNEVRTAVECLYP